MSQAIGSQEAKKPISQEGRTKSQEANSEKKLVKRQFVNFAFFKIETSWRRLSDSEKTRGIEEFVQAVESYQKQMMVLPYSLLGIRGDCDFMLWRIGADLGLFQAMSSKLFFTGLGKYLTTPYSYLSMTKRSFYVDTINPEHGETRTQIVPGKYQYLFVYPFVKTREWYQLPFENRQKMMDEHIRIGNKYPTVKLNTTYSFGLDDQEFVVAFETDFPQDFLDLVQELREAQTSRYTLRDTPTFTCAARNLKEILSGLG